VRSRVVAAAVAVLTLAGVGLAAARVWPSSDAATTEIRVAAEAGQEAEPAPLPASIRPLWSVSTRTAGQAPVEGPTAVVAGTDRVAGLDPATGRERWSYRRGNARLCGWTPRDGVVVALFAKSAGCRELVGLDAATGGRRWYRTVEVTTDAALSSGPGVAVVTAESQLVAVDTATGLNRWSHTASGCRLDPVVVGRVAAASVARCAGGELRLIGHDPYAEEEPWTVRLPAGSDPVVVAAEDEVAVLTRSAGRPTLTAYTGVAGSDKRKVARRLGAVTDRRLAYGGDARPVAAVQDRVLVVWTGRSAVAVDGRRRAVRWSAPASGPPLLDDGRVLLAQPGLVTTRPLGRGTPVTRVPVPGGQLPTGATLSRTGALLLAAGGDRLAAYG
jgi:hypothetical protein